MLWSVKQQGDFGIAYTIKDLLADEKMIGGLLGNGKIEKRQVLEEALQKAVRDGIILRVNNPEGNTFYFINSPRGRSAAELVSKGQDSGAPPSVGASLDAVQSNIFQLYEENIGPLTPLVADMLQDAQDAYPVDWIREAVEIAVQNNVRRWKYIETILSRWQEEGRNGTNQQDNQEDYRRYLKGKYGQFGEH